MALIAFVDETGDHSLSKINKSYPVFSLAVIVCKEEEYLATTVPCFNKMKHLFWGHEGVILRSYDIRKKLGDFDILQNKDTREMFMSEMNQAMTNCPFAVISTTIDKQKHLDKYGANASSPYDYALTVCMERLVSYAIDSNEQEVRVVAECRNQSADSDFRRVFQNVVRSGTFYIPRSEFAKVKFTLGFATKQKNVTGLQIADLVAHPIVTKVLNPSKEYVPYTIINPKFYRKNGRNLGLKVLP